MLAFDHCRQALPACSAFGVHLQFSSSVLEINFCCPQAVCAPSIVGSNEILKLQVLLIIAVAHTLIERWNACNPPHILCTESRP
eukprot:5126405-Pleurochrysis_carterae.AAC.2